VILVALCLLGGASQARAEGEPLVLRVKWKVPTDTLFLEHLRRDTSDLCCPWVFLVEKGDSLEITVESTSGFSLLRVWGYPDLARMEQPAQELRWDLEERRRLNPSYFERKTTVLVTE